MAAPIIGGLIQFIEQNLSLQVWDGEIPRYGDNLQELDLTDANPLFKVDMLADLTRTLTFEDAYGDGGPIGIWVMATTRFACENIQTEIEELLVQSNNWPLISLQTLGFYVFKILLSSWSCKQLEGVRTRDSSLVYLGMQNFQVEFHGSVPTR